MNRLQKKCLVFSAGMHGLLAVILFGSAAFRDRPEPTDAPILSLIPANILDQAGVGGGEQPAPSVHVAQPQPQSQPQPQTQARVERQQPAEQEVRRPVVESDDALPRPSKTRHQQEIHPTFTLAARTTNHKTSETSEPSSEAASARAEARRRRAIESSLGNLASDVRTSGAGKTIVDVPGVGGGGEIFAGYRDVIRSIYYRAWRTPENGTARATLPEVRIVVARDGTIISAELVSPSGDATLDKSVSRALDAVPKLPPFPASAHDEQRTFRIQFSLDLKESSG